MRRLPVLLLLIPLFAAACGPLPRPFKPEGKEAVNLAALEQGVELLVLPVEGDAPSDDPGDPYAAAYQLAQALRTLGIQAAAEAPAADRLLRGRSRVERSGGADGGREQIVIDWELLPPGDAVPPATLSGQVPPEVVRFEQVSSLPPGLWGRGQSTAVSSVMAQAAQLVATHLDDGREAARRANAEPLSRVSKPRLVLLPLDLLPGDGNLSLPRALERSLQSRDFDIGWDIAEDDLLVMGDLAVTPDGGGMDKIAVTWWVVQTSDGTDLGKVEQENRIPAGTLDGQWGPVAQAIATGAADGIEDIIKRRWKP